MPVFLERDVLEAGGNGPSEDVLRFFFILITAVGKSAKPKLIPVPFISRLKINTFS